MKPLTVGMLLLISLSACAPSRVGGSKTVDQALNDLRREKTVLEKEVARLEGNIKDRMAQIESLEEQLEHKSEVTDVRPADIPRATRIEFGRYSGAIDTNRDGKDDTLRIYVRSHDQFGRFIPVAGKASLEAVAIREGQPPLQVASGQWSGEQFKAAYRSGMTGTHYTLDAALPEALPDKVKDVTVKVTITDAATGLKMSDQLVVGIKR